jgi:hypothetical protein
MGWLKQWFGLKPNKNLVLMLGLGMQCIPLLILIVKQKLWRNGSLKRLNPDSLDRWQILFAASWLIWMVIFNHMAESATYVIAVGGSLLALSQLVTSENNHFETSQSSNNHEDQNKKVESNFLSNQAVQVISWRRYIHSKNLLWILTFILMFFFTILGPTDVYPKALRFWIVETAQLKAFPCILLWGLVLLKMLKISKS